MRLRLLKADITTQHVDVIVNAANSTLLGGGGVDGAIHRAGGPAILAECRELRRERYPEGLATGTAVSTTAGALPALRIIHTVGPVWAGGRNHEAELLARAYRSSLALAAEEGMRSVAFPSISTGAYGYPKAEAARIALTAILDFLRENDTIDEVRMVLFSDDDLQLHTSVLRALEGS